MKFTFALIGIISIQILASAQNRGQHPFKLEGTIKDMDSGYVYLNYIPNGEMGIIDSCKLTAGHFVFNGTVTEPTKAQFRTFGFGGKFEEGNSTEFYIEPGDIKLLATKDQFRTLQLTGSASDNDRVKLEKLREPVQIEISSVDGNIRYYENEYRIEKKKNSDSSRLILLTQKKDSAWAVLKKLFRKMAQIDSVFIIENPDSYVAADILSNSNVSWIAFPSLDNLYSRFPEYIKQSFPGKKIKFEIDRDKAISVGSDAKLFIAIDSKRDTIKLSDYRNRKYILLDFGASWCHPCRSLIPFLKKQYTTYSSQLEIVSIANQKEENDWRKAIVEDGTKWPQIIENNNLMPIEPATSTITDMYYITGIPALVLIDKDLKIVGRYGGFYYSDNMLDLEQKLAEVIK